MADLLANQVKYAVADPFRHAKVHHTETQGNLIVSKTGYVILNNKETADEIKTKNPHFVVSEMRGFIPPSRTMFVMPEMPWKKKAEATDVNHSG